MNREEARKRAIELVEQMTIEEMASQLRFDAPEIERLGIPAYNWWGEGLHGVARAGTATSFPQSIGLGATFDKDLLYEVGDCISTEARAKYNEAVKHEDRDIYKGITLWSPNVNLFRDPRWGRGQETYGEDPQLISDLAVPFIQGLQGDGEFLKTAACAKHFAVHSGPEGVRHEFDAVASMKDMWETYLPAFETCVKEANVESVMGAYNRTNGEPCCAHEYLMETVLREQWGFEGHYVSDCWAIRDFHENHKVTKNIKESVKLALEKGCDLNCGCTYEKIMDAYRMGMVSDETIKESAVRLFTTRFLLGMFDETEYDNIPFEVVDSKQHAEIAKKAARESVVLLKNDGILPLCKDKIKTIGVIGPNADSRSALIGNYHGTASEYITVLDGIRRYVSDDVRVYYAQGSHLHLDRVEPLAQPDDRLAEAKTVAEHSDVVVLCLGLDETLEGEEGDTGNAYASGDKLDLHFPEGQRKLLEAVKETGTPFIVCSMTGSAMDLRYADEHAAAVLQTWYPGAKGGLEIAKILFGDVSPSGKLPVTFYTNDNYLPEFTDYSMKGRTYRYMTEAPLYPFGYGLTYGNTEVLSIELTESVKYADVENKNISVCVTMENKSDIATEDVLQVYVRVEGSDNEVPNPKLAVFERISFDAHEIKDITLKIPKQAFSTVNEDGARQFDGCKAMIYAGFGQPDDRTSELLGKNAKSTSI